jgi:uncharacterized membrane protein
LSDTARRSLVKTISWRITGSGATFIIAYSISGNFTVSGIIAAIQLVCNTILYFIHERVWNNIGWGRSDLP